MVKIKICGLTNLLDYNNAVSCGADFTGFIFYKKSERYINESEVKKIISSGIKSDNLRVGVFVNESIDEIQRIYENAGLNIVQLHGDETVQFCKDLNLPYWKVIRIKDEISLSSIDQYDCETILIDTYSKELYGGTGISIEKKLIGKAAQSGKKIIAAGGLGVHNIKDILEKDIFGVDINSSIEEKPGKKDLMKMKDIINMIKGF